MGSWKIVRIYNSIHVTADLQMMNKSINQTTVKSFDAFILPCAIYIMVEINNYPTNNKNQQKPNESSDLSSSHQPKTHTELWHVMCFTQQGGNAIHHLSDVWSWDGVDHSGLT